MKISIPDDTQLVEYNIRTGQMVKLIRNLKSQNSELRQARDLLLPKVMSGEIDVEEISGATYFEDESFEGSMAAEDVVAYQ